MSKAKAAAISNSKSKTINVYYQHQNRSLVKKELSGKATNLGGILTSGPAVFPLTTRSIVPEDGTSVFVRGKDQAIWGRQYTEKTGKWSGWYSLGGRSLGAPTITCTGNGMPPPTVYVRGTDGALWSRRADGTGGWTSHGGKLTSDPSGLTTGLLGDVTPRATDAPPVGVCPGNDVFALGTDKAVWQWDGGTERWSKVGGKSNAAPAAIILQNREENVFVRGTDNALWMAWKKKASDPWSQWKKIGGILGSAPAATTTYRSDVSTDFRAVFAQGSNHQIYSVFNFARFWDWSIFQVK